MSLTTHWEVRFKSLSYYVIILAQCFTAVAALYVDKRME